MTKSPDQPSQRMTALERRELRARQDFGRQCGRYYGRLYEYFQLNTWEIKYKGEPKAFSKERRSFAAFLYQERMQIEDDAANRPEDFDSFAQFIKSEAKPG